MPEKDVPVAEVLAAAARWLEAAQVQYALVGGLVIGAWAEPRVTADVDVIVAATGDRVEEALAQAKPLGFKFEKTRKAAQLRRQGMCRLFYGNRHFDVVCGTSAVEIRAIERAVPVRLLGQDVRVVTAEDLILFKLLAARPQDLVDVQRVFQAQRGRLDKEYMRGVARQMARDLFRSDIVKRLEEHLSER